MNNIHEKNFVIISAHKPENDKGKNARLQADLLNDLLVLVGWSTLVVPVSGKYNSIYEESFAVILPDDADLVYYENTQEGLVELGKKYKQECLLVVFNTPAEPYALFFPLNADEVSSDVIPRHPWYEISKNECVSHTSWTCVRGKYFIADETESLTSDGRTDDEQLDEDLDFILSIFDEDEVVCIVEDIHRNADFTCTGDCQTGVSCDDCDQKE